jgi:hypothetical protein
MHVRFTPKADKKQIVWVCPLSAISGHNAVQQISTGLSGLFAVC